MENWGYRLHKGMSSLRHDVKNRKLGGYHHRNNIAKSEPRRTKKKEGCIVRILRKAITKENLSTAALRYGGEGKALDRLSM